MDEMRSKQDILDEFKEWLEEDSQRYLNDFLTAYILTGSDSLIALFLMAKYPTKIITYHNIYWDKKALEYPFESSNTKPENYEPVTTDNVEQKKSDIQTAYIAHETESKEPFRHKGLFRVANFYIETLLEYQQPELSETITTEMEEIYERLEKYKEAGLISKDTSERTPSKRNHYIQALLEVFGGIQNAYSELKKTLPKIYKLALDYYDYYSNVGHNVGQSNDFILSKDKDNEKRYLPAYKLLCGLVDDGTTKIMYVTIKNLWGYISPLSIFLKINEGKAFVSTFKEEIKEEITKTKVKIEKLRKILNEAWEKKDITKLEYKDYIQLMDKLEEKKK